MDREIVYNYNYSQLIHKVCINCRKPGKFNSLECDNIITEERKIINRWKIYVRLTMIWPLDIIIYES